MGWSCNKNASIRLDAWEAFCRVQGGSQNTFYDRDGSKKMFERSNREHSDGAATGTVYKFTDGDNVVACGTFRINGNGTIERAPKALRFPVHKLVVVDKFQRWDLRWRGDEPNDDVLRVFIKKEWMKQYEQGGANHHLLAAGTEVPYPNSADIIDLNTNVVVASWKTAMFEAW